MHIPVRSGQTTKGKAAFLHTKAFPPASGDGFVRAAPHFGGMTGAGRKKGRCFYLPFYIYNSRTCCALRRISARSALRESKRRSGLRKCVSSRRRPCP